MTATPHKKWIFNYDVKKSKCNGKKVPVATSLW